MAAKIGGSLKVGEVVAGTVGNAAIDNPAIRKVEMTRFDWRPSWNSVLLCNNSFYPFL